MKASQITKCVDCGREFLRKELNRKFRCPDCAMKKMTNVITEMHYKTGPEYEHWKKRIKDQIGRL